METLDAFIDRLIKRGLLTSEELRGCTQEEIDGLKAGQGVSRLPDVYEAFVRRMGCRPGRLLQGTDWARPDLPFDLKAEARQLLEESGLDPALLDDAFVFAMHQGYQFWFFRNVSAGGDAVWFYREGEPKPEQKFDSFLAFLKPAEEELEMLLEDERALASMGVVVEGPEQD